MLLTTYLEIPLVNYEASAIGYVFEEMFIPYNDLGSIWDLIGTKCCHQCWKKFLIGPNLTHNPGFTIWGRDSDGGGAFYSHFTS